MGIDPQPEQNKTEQTNGCLNGYKHNTHTSSSTVVLLLCDSLHVRSPLRIGTRYAELLEMPLMLFVIWQSAQLTINRLEQKKGTNNQYLTPILIGTLALLWLVGVELATTAVLQGGWWNGIRVYFVARDAIAGPVYALAVLSYAIMPWYVWRCQNQQTKWTIEFDGSVDEDEGWF